MTPPSCLPKARRSALILIDDWVSPQTIASQADPGKPANLPNAREAYRVRFNASSSRIAAEPGFNGFGWLSCGDQPLSHKISNVARKRPSGSAKRSA
jgi:hypothetical protein